MAYIQSKPIQAYPWPVRWVLRRQRRVYGDVLPPALLWGRMPDLFFGLLGMLRLFQRKRFLVSENLRSLASVRIAQLNGCEFCVDLNAYLYLKARGEAGKATVIGQWRDHGDLFNAKEQVVLAYAEAMTDHCKEINASHIEALRAYFSEDGITQLTAWIAFQNMSAKFNAALGAQAHGFCDVSTMK